MTSAKIDRFTDKQVELAGFARSLSHPARIAIVRLLQSHEKLSCSQIVAEIPLAQATVSQHLKALRESGLVSGASCGAQVSYSLVPDQIRDFCKAFRQMLEQY